MSISSISGSSSGWGMGAIQQQRKQPEVTKDQLTQLDQTLKSEGKDTSNLDKVISNFSQLDTDGNGKISMDELKNGASQAGISLPKGGGHHHHHAKKADNDQDGNSVSSNSWGPPPGLLSNSGDGTSDASSTGASSFDPNSFMLSMLEKFAGSDPGTQQAPADLSSVSVAA